MPYLWIVLAASPPARSTKISSLGAAQPPRSLRWEVTRWEVWRAASPPRNPLFWWWLPASPATTTRKKDLEGGYAAPNPSTGQRVSVKAENNRLLIPNRYS